MDDIVSIAIDAGLFENNITNNALRTIPKGTFGVFVTIERNQKLNKWPEDIHGCIGYWNENFEEIPKKEIIEHIKTVSYDATHNDSRKNFFKKKLLMDLKSKYIVTFMLLPVMNIDRDTGSIKNINENFDNNKYGIIVQNKDKSRATYLPGVFTNSSWEQISSDLKSKANIQTSDDNIMFYAYKTIILENSILDQMIYPIVQFMEKYYKESIPYIFENNVVGYNKSEFIRNIASICDLLEIQNHGYELSESLSGIIRENIDEHIKLFKNKKIELRQSLPFLLIAMFLINSIAYNQHINNMTNYIISQMTDIKENSKEFEYGEVLYGITFIGKKLNDDKFINIVLKEQSEIYNELSNTELNIFQLNWYAQSIYMLHKMNIEYINKINHSVKLVNKILPLSNTYNHSSESNLLVVAFEALTGLYQIVMNKIDDNIKIKIENEIMKLLTLIYQRRNEYGLIKFIDGSSRIDITGHFINGLFNISNNISQTGGTYQINYIENKHKYLLSKKIEKSK